MLYFLEACRDLTRASVSVPSPSFGSLGVSDTSLTDADVETIEKMAVLEFKHGDAERGKTLLEGLVDRYPKRLDLWAVYIDQLAKVGDIQGVR